MSWFKVSFAAEEFKSQNIYAEFAKLLLERMPSDIGLLASIKKDEQGEVVEGTYFFSPACSEFCPELISHYGAEACEPPQNASWMMGNLDFKKSL